MHSHFGLLMKEATSLTGAGDLRSAMAAITAAMYATDPAAVTGAQDSERSGTVIKLHATATKEEVAPPLQNEEDGARFVSGQYAHRAGKRDYKLFIPAVRAGKPRALVLMLHGCTQDPDDFACGTGMNDIAAEHNVLVLYPEQTRHANAQGCWNWFKHNHQGRSRGEPALLADLARHTAESHGVDAAEVYVAGLSAGGAMAAILAVTHPDVFAAAGVHSGLPAGAAGDLQGAIAAMQGQGTKACEVGPPSPVRMIVFHGDADTTVHHSNADRIAAAHGGAAVEREEQAGFRRGTRVCTRYLHKDAEGVVVVEQWRVHGAGHAWSGGKTSGSYTDPRGPDASAEMMRFFLQS